MVPLNRITSAAIRFEDLSFKQASGTIPLTDCWHLAEEYVIGIQKINEDLLKQQEIAEGVALSY